MCDGPHNLSGKMLVKITGKNLDIGSALRNHVEARLKQICEKYFYGTVSSHVTIEKQKSQFATDCTLHLATGLVLQSHGAAGDALVGFDNAAEHLEKQLRRYKRRLKDHHKNRQEPVKTTAATSYVIAADGHSEETEPSDLSPVIIAETSANVPELSVGEAVMQLDISSNPFLLFRNARDGGLNVIYRRPDGNIGWIDPRHNLSR
jgi:ribosome hibernation promoting factor